MKKAPLSAWLLIILAMGQGAALVYASISLDGHTEGPLFWSALIRGLFVGIGVSFAASYSGYQLPRVKHKQAAGIGWKALGTLVACSALVVGVSTVETPHGLIRWIVSNAYAVMTEAAVLAVAATSGRLFPVADEEKPQAKTERKASVRKQKAAVACKYGCGMSGSQNAMNAHYKGCQKNPARQFVQAAKS